LNSSHLDFPQSRKEESNLKLPQQPNKLRPGKKLAGLVIGANPAVRYQVRRN